MQERHNSGHQRLSERDAKLVEETRKTIKASLDLLKQSLPDTFLGRQTQTPIPKEARAPTD